MGRSTVRELRKVKRTETLRIPRFLNEVSV